MTSSNILFFCILALLGIVVIAVIPGVSSLIKPGVALIAITVKTAFLVIYSWVFYLIKLVFSSHVDLFNNLTKTAEEIDPSVKVHKGPSRIGEDI